MRRRRSHSLVSLHSKKGIIVKQATNALLLYADMWTNTCCSHPLGIPGETGVGLDASVQGVRRAAQRKLDHELGIRASQVPLDKFDFLTRIHYKSASDGKWGEHESKFSSYLTNWWSPTTKTFLMRAW